MQPWHAWLLAALLLTAQALGLAHWIDHAPGSVHRLQSLQAVQAVQVVAWASPEAAGPASPDAQQAPAAQGMATHQAGDADCRLVDQLAHADALAGAQAALPAVLPTPVLAAELAARVAVLPPPAAYQARAPPLA